MKRITNKHKGFTLIELLVAVTISGFIVAGCYQLFINQAKLSSYEQFVTAGQHDLRTAVDIMAVNLERAAYNIRKDIVLGTPLKQYADPSIIIGFWINHDEDTDTLDRGEFIEYEFIEAQKEVVVVVQEGDAPTTFLENVDTFEIAYYSDLFDDTKIVADPALNYDRIERIVLSIRVKIKDMTKPSSEWKTRSLKREIVPFNIN
ncbi:MAG: prepilin-type N-terminal cleavage/methylation domain-containing protein [Pseudomonadota bacterium]